MKDNFAREGLYRFLDDKSRNATEYQRNIIYLTASVLVAIGCILHFCGVFGSSASFMKWISFAMFLCNLFLFILFTFKKISSSSALSIFGLSAILLQAASMLYVSVNEPFQSYFVIFDGLINLVDVFFLAVAFLYKAASVAGGINIAVLMVSSIIVKDPVAWQFSVLLSICTLFLVAMSFLMYSKVKRLQDENVLYKEDERLILKILHLNRSEFMSYLDLCKTDRVSDADIERFFSVINERTQRNIVYAVNKKQALETADRADLRASFPSFTPTELEVARLVLQDKKLSEICQLTGKSENNVSTVRSHIRRKMSLSPEDNLKEEMLRVIMAGKQ